MANRSRRKKTTQNGVQAIFTAEDNWRGKVPAAIGLLAAGAGVSLWTWLLIQTSSSLALVSVSMLLAMSGIGLCAYSLAVRRGRQENNRIKSALYDLEVLVEPKNGSKDSVVDTDSKSGPPREEGGHRRVSKTLAVAIVEAVVLLIVYGGLVQEYASNINMQQWMRANLWPGVYMLNFNTLFVVVGGLLGTIAFQILLGKQDTA